MDALSTRALIKRYGATIAVRGVSARFEAGKLHAVIGENGAGKSTLLKMACGLVVPDEGSVDVEGERLEPHAPREAIRRGVGMVQQHFALIESMSVLENVMLGAETLRGGLLDESAAKARLAAIAKDLGVEIDPAAMVRDLGVGDRQRLEIARVLYKGARVLVLDEPTAVLVPSEAEALYVTLRRLVAGGRTVVVVTHKLDEVTGHADTVSVMRKGELVLARDVDKGAGDAEVRALAAAVMGGEPPPELVAERAVLGDRVLALRDVRKGRELRGVSLEVRAGEIVGIAGVEGNGQRELVRVIAGLEEADAGELDISARVAVVHEDRHHDGLVLDASVADNIVLGEHGSFSRAGILDARAMKAAADARAEQGAVEPRDTSLEARGLSGGNQQKVVVARALARTASGSKVLVLSHPTRGVDVGAARIIHERIGLAASSGAGVLLVSSDLAELRTLAHRVLVMARGRIVADVSPDTSNERLGELMLAEGAVS